MRNWLITNWLAILALIVAFVGGWPGLLKIIENFRPFHLSGSVKFYAFTQGSEPPEDGIILGLSIINEGNKNLIWRKLKGKLTKGKTPISLNPKMIPTDIVFGKVKPTERDLLKQQVLLPSIPHNGYLLLVAPPGSLTEYNKASFDVQLEFELETGNSVNVVLPIKGTMSVQSGENFPSHSVEF